MQTSALKSLLYSLLIIVVVSVAPGVYALDRSAFFQASSPVINQGVDERKRAASLGLIDVLVRMSGDEQLAVNSVVVAKSRNALSYADQFQYVELSDPDLVYKGYKAELQLRFNPRSVRRLLLESGLPFWPVNRPDTLVWLIEDSVTEGRQTLTVGSESPILDGLVNAATERGIPLRFPLLDIEDQIALSSDALWSLDELAILDASKRYDAGVVLVGRFTKTSSGDVWATWQFYHNGQNRIIDDRSSDAHWVGALPIPVLAQFLSERYAIKANQEQSPDYVMVVDQVTGFADYRRVIDYLEGLASVSKVSLDEVDGQTLKVRVSSETGVDKFIRTLGLEDKLLVRENPELQGVPEWQLDAKGTESNPLLYTWSTRR